MSKVLTIVSEKSTVSMIERAFQKELPRVQFKVVSKEELIPKAVKQMEPDMVIVEKGLSDIDNLSFIRQIRSTSKVPIVLMATEKDAVHIGPLVSDKYESIFEASREDRLPEWLKQFHRDSSKEIDEITNK